MSAILQRKVLVLNKSWNAVGVATLRRALGLIWKTYATIIDPSQDFQKYTWERWKELTPKDNEDCISTSSIKLRIPEIILLHEYDKLPRQRSNFSRRALHKRDFNTCQYCGDQPGIGELTVDHILPKSSGGRTSWENCVLACSSCNSRKANRTPEQAGMKLRCVPMKPKFNLFKSDNFLESWGHWLIDKG